MSRHNRHALRTGRRNILQNKKVVCSVYPKRFPNRTTDIVAFNHEGAELGEGVERQTLRALEMMNLGAGET